VRTPMFVRLSVGWVCIKTERPGAILTESTDDYRSADLFAAWLVESSVGEVVNVADRIEQTKTLGPYPSTVCVHHVHELGVVGA